MVEARTEAPTAVGGAARSSPGRRRHLRPLAGLLALKLLLAGLLLRHGFVSVSGDDFMRALIALEWARRPFLVSTEFDTASSLWLPLQFWLNGVVLRFVPDPWLVPIAVNVVLSLGGLGYLFAIAQRLRDPGAGLLTVLLVGLLPWHAWLSISGLAEIPLLFFSSTALYYLVRWELDGTTRWAVLAAVGGLGATMVRPEGWLYAVPLTACLAGAAIRDRRWTVLVAAGLPWGFVAAWLTFNYWAYGEAWHFVQLSRRNFQLEAQEFDSALVRLLQFPFLMVIVSPTLFALLVPSLLHVWRRGPPVARRFAAVAGSGFGLLVAAGLLGLGTTATPQRYVVGPLALLTPVIAVWAREVAAPALGRRLATLAVLAYGLTGVFFAFQFPREFQDEVRVARVLAAMRETGQLPPGALVASDRAVAAVRLGNSLTPERRVRLLVDRWALQVLSRMPDAFVDRDWSVDGPARPPDLGDRHVRVIAVETADLEPAVPAGFTPAGRVGSYRLFAAGIPREAMPPAPPLPSTTLLGADLGRRLRLAGYQQDAWGTPRVVRLLFDWTDEGEGLEGATARVRLIGTTGPVAVRAYPLRDYLPTGPRPRSIEVPIRFGEEFDVPPGPYSLEVAVSGAGDARGSDRDLALGPFYLIRNKRDVLKRVLTASPVDPRLVARLLLSL